MILFPLQSFSLPICFSIEVLRIFDSIDNGKFAMFINIDTNVLLLYMPVLTELGHVAPLLLCKDDRFITLS